MINDILTGSKTGLAALATAALLYTGAGCSKNPVSHEPVRYQDSHLTVRADAKEDSSLCDVIVYTEKGKPCDVNVYILNGLDTIAAKSGSVSDSARFRFANLSKPLDATVIASNDNDYFAYFAFSDAGAGVGDQNGSIQPGLIEKDDHPALDTLPNQIPVKQPADSSDDNQKLLKTKAYHRDI
jgi:hypothetical protein